MFDGSKNNKEKKQDKTLSQNRLADKVVKKKSGRPEKEAGNLQKPVASLPPTVTDFSQRVDQLRETGKQLGKRKKLFFVIGIILLFAGSTLAGGYFYRTKIIDFLEGPRVQEEIICPKDAKVCLDGSSVSRILPDCEFAECPEDHCKNQQLLIIFGFNEKSLPAFNYLDTNRSNIFIEESGLLKPLLNNEMKNYSLDCSKQYYLDEKDEKNILNKLPASKLITKSNNNFKEWNVYLDKDLGVEFYYPQDWEKFREFSNMGMTKSQVLYKYKDKFKKDREMVINGPLTIYIDKPSLNFYWPLENIESIEKLEFPNNLLSFLMTSSQNSVITYDEVTSRTIAYLVKLSNNKHDFYFEYVFAYNPQEESRETVEREHEENFSTILSTFKFIETIDTTDWQTYRNEEYRYKIEYPDTIDISHQEDFIKVTSGEQDLYTVSIIETAGPLPEVMDMELFESKTVSFDNYNIVRESFKGALESNEDQYYVRVVLAHKDTLYQVDLNEDNYQEAIELFDQMVTTYKWLDDSDSDGLFDDEEAEYGTDPNNPDSDGDGYLDGERG